MSSDFRFRRDETGRPVADPPPGAQGRDLRRLAEFLTGEVNSPDYAEALLQRAAQSTAAGAEDCFTGNAFAVTFMPAEVVIEHLHVADWPKIHVSRPEFTEAAAAWLAWMKQTPT